MHVNEGDCQGTPQDRFACGMQALHAWMLVYQEAAEARLLHELQGMHAAVHHHSKALLQRGWEAWQEGLTALQDEAATRWDWQSITALPALTMCMLLCGISRTSIQETSVVSLNAVLPTSVPFYMACFWVSCRAVFSVLA